MGRKRLSRTPLAPVCTRAHVLAGGSWSLMTASLPRHTEPPPQTAGVGSSRACALRAPAGQRLGSARRATRASPSRRTSSGRGRVGFENRSHVGSPRTGTGATLAHGRAPPIVSLPLLPRAFSLTRLRIRRGGETTLVIARVRGAGAARRARASGNELVEARHFGSSLGASKAWVRSNRCRRCLLLERECRDGGELELFPVRVWLDLAQPEQCGASLALLGALDRL